MEPYYIKHQHQETPNHSKRSFANCYWLHTRYKHSTLHEKIKILPMDTHLKLHATQVKQLTQIQTHLLHHLNSNSDPPTNMKATIFYNNEHTNIIISKPDITLEECRENLKHIHTTISSQYFNSKKNSKVTRLHPMTFNHQNKLTTCYAYKTGTIQSQQITTQDCFYSDPLCPINNRQDS